MNFTTFFLWVLGLIYFLSCLWLIIVVLLQEGKSGSMANEGMGTAPSALTDSFGAGGAQKNLFRVTAITATIFFILAIALTMLGNKRDYEGGALQLPASETSQQSQLPNTATNQGMQTQREAAPESPAGNAPQAPPDPDAQ